MSDKSEVEPIRVFMYHEIDAPGGKVFSEDEVCELSDDWVDTPAKFGLAKVDSVNTQGTDGVSLPTPTQEVENESVPGMSEADDVKALGLDAMSKDELDEFAKNELGMDLDKRKSESTFRDIIRQVLAAQGKIEPGLSSQ